MAIHCASVRWCMFVSLSARSSHTPALRPPPRSSSALNPRREKFVPSVPSCRTVLLPVVIHQCLRQVLASPLDGESVHSLCARMHPVQARMPTTCVRPPSGTFTTCPSGLRSMPRTPRSRAAVPPPMSSVPLLRPPWEGLQRATNSDFDTFLKRKGLANAPSAVPRSVSKCRPQWRC